MDDSNILYYLVLGAIYLISRALRKKKPQPKPRQKDGSINRPQPKFESESRNQPTTRPTSVEDILKELTQDFEPDKPAKVEREEPNIEPAYVPEPRVDYQDVNIEEVAPDEEVDIVPHKLIQRDKPVYRRAEEFQLDDQSNDAVEEVYELLENEHGARKAIILNEIFNRKY